MQSDILILIKDQVGDDEATIIANAIYCAASTALVTFNTKSNKSFLVRFDPNVDSPQSILRGARSVRPDAMMAGG